MSERAVFERIRKLKEKIDNPPEEMDLLFYHERGLAGMKRELILLESRLDEYRKERESMTIEEVRNEMAALEEALSRMKKPGCWSEALSRHGCICRLRRLEEMAKLDSL